MKSELSEILGFFNLGNLSTYIRAGGFANENYFVTTASGEFVVKVLREHAASSVNSEVPFLQRVTAHQFPAVPYISSTSGECVYESAEITAVAMEKIRGEPPVRSPSTNATMGTTLAHLHSIPTDDLITRPSFMDQNFMESTISTLDSLVPAESLNPYVGALNELANFRGALQEKEQNIIHCDFTPNNCLFDGEQLIAVIDWEEVTLGSPLLDLANAILSTCFVEAQFDQGMFQALVGAYSDINESELGCLEDALRFAGLTFSLWVYLRWGVESNDPFVVSSRQLYWRYNLEELQLNP